MAKFQKQIITEYVQKNPNLTSLQVSEKLGIKYGSVSGRMSELKKLGILTVSDDHEYQTTEDWWKKLLKTGKTAKPRTGSTTENIEVITYEQNDSNQFRALLDGALKNIDELEYIDNAGYDYCRVEAIQVESNYVFDSALLLVGSKRKTITI